MDQNLSSYDQKNQTEYHHTYITENKKSIFGEYKSLDNDKLSKASTETLVTISSVQNEAKKDALRTVSFLPWILFFFYLAFILYFKLFKGGYKPVVLAELPDKGLLEEDMSVPFDGDPKTEEVIVK